MSKSNRSEELMDAWHRGQLTDEEKLEWDALAKETDLLNDQAEYKELIDAIENKGRKQLRLEMQGWSAEQNNKASRKRILLWTVVAASIMLGVLIFIFQQNPLDLQAYEEPFPNVISSTHRTLTTSSTSEIAAAMQPYDLQDWKTASEKIGHFIQKNGEPEAMYLYLGISAYHLQSYKEAQTAFEHVMEHSQDQTFTEPANWFSTLTHIKLNDIEAAKTALKEMAKSPHYRSYDAKILLKEL